MGIGDWGLGIGDWGLGPIPNPHLSIIKSKIYKINFKLKIILFYNFNFFVLLVFYHSLIYQQTA